MAPVAVLSGDGGGGGFSAGAVTFHLEAPAAEEAAQAEAVALVEAVVVAAAWGVGLPSALYPQRPTKASHEADAMSGR